MAQKLRLEQVPEIHHCPVKDKYLKTVPEASAMALQESKPPLNTIE